MASHKWLEPELDMTPIQKFSQAEINVLLLIISLGRNFSSGIIKLSFEGLRELSSEKTSATKLFMKDLVNSFDKLLELNLSIKDEVGLTLEKFKMFTGYKINAASQEPYVEIYGHEKAVPLANSFDQWIVDSLQEFLALNSSYSKTMFRLLKQSSQTGNVYFSKEAFIEQLNIPASYKQGDIDRTILAPIKEELTPLFEELTIQKEYSRGRGKPVKGYRFTFKAEESIDVQ